MQPYLLIQWLPDEPSQEVSVLRREFSSATTRTRDIATKEELRREIIEWSSGGNAQALYIGAHGHGVEGQPFDGIGPDPDFMSWMELAQLLAELSNPPDALHLGACGSVDIVRSWSEFGVASRLPEMSLVTHEATTIAPFIEVALRQTLLDGGWSPLIFLDKELPRLRLAAGPVVNMFYSGWACDTRRMEFVAVEDFPSRVGVTFEQALTANGNRPLRALRYLR